MVLQTILHNSHRLAPSVVQSRQTQTFKAFYATIRDLRRRQESADLDEAEPPDNDFILSILRANPSSRDTKSYLASFGINHKPRSTSAHPPGVQDPSPSDVTKHTTKSAAVEHTTIESGLRSPLVAAILNPIHRRTALVKIQGPFTDRQLESITRGMVYLEKLGLVSVIVVENDELVRGDEEERESLVQETMRVVKFLEEHGTRARPVLGAVVRLGPKPGDEELATKEGHPVPEAHAFPSDLTPIRSALRAGEIPVLPPMALDSFCRSTPVDANDVVAALARGMVEAAALDGQDQHHEKSEKETDALSEEVNLTPLRLMIINREGGVPSYARSGNPHLLINLTSEYDHIQGTFLPQWRSSHPTSLSNLSLARTCLSYMPPTSSAVMVNHRSPTSLIANLITNKPALSSSLPHALLQGNRKLTPNTPTLLRRGLPIRVLRAPHDIDRPKMTSLLEQSFKRTLNPEPFFARLEKHLDFAIVAGDYAGAAIVTTEPAAPESPHGPIAYLDKFAVLPSHQGDGTVDFLWVALHDESYGLGLPYAVNPNPGGNQGMGEGRDLVWRSRANNPVNKWYFERSSGYLRMGEWILFWCDGEKRLKTEEGRRANAGLSYVEEWERGRLSVWADVIHKIPSAWK